MPEGVFEARSRRLSAGKSMPTIPLGEAKLNLAALPAKYRDAAFKSLERLTTEPLNLTSDRSKAQVPLEAYQKVVKSVREAADKERRLGTGDLRRAEADIAEKTAASTKSSLLERRKLVPKTEWARYGLDDASIGLSSQLSKTMVPEKPKYETVGEMARAAEERLAQIASIAAKPGMIGGNTPVGQAGADLVGGIVATPVTIVENVEFFLDPKYREQVNPQGTTPLDYAGAALKLWLNVGAPGGGKIAGAALDKIAPVLVEKGIARQPLLQRALAQEAQKVDTVAFGKALVNQGISPKEAARTAYLATQAMRQVSQDELNLVLSKYPVEQKALPAPEGELRTVLKDGRIVQEPVVQRALPVPEPAKIEIPEGGVEPAGQNLNLVKMAEAQRVPESVAARTYVDNSWRDLTESLVEQYRPSKARITQKSKYANIRKRLKESLKEGQPIKEVEDFLLEEFGSEKPVVKESERVKLLTIGEAEPIPPGGYVTLADEPKVSEPTAPKVKNAKEVRSDQGQVQEPRRVGQGVQDQGRENLQQPEKAVRPTAPQEKVTGLANQVQEREALEGIISDVEKTTGKSGEDWQAIGRKSVSEVDDPDAYVNDLAKRVGDGQEELTGKSVGELLEGKRRKLNRINDLTEKLKADPKNRKLLNDLDLAKKDLDDYLTEVQAGKGRWSDVGRTLQAGSELDTGNFADVLQSARTNAAIVGENVPKSVERRLQEYSQRVSELEKKIAQKEGKRSRSSAEQKVRSTRQRKFDREVIRKEREDILKEIDGVLSLQVGEGLVTNAPNLAALAKPVAKLALNFAKEGAATLEDVVIAVQKVLVSKGIAVDDQFIVDSLGTPQKTRAVTDAEKEITKLRAQARAESTAGKQKIKARIAELEKIAESGNVPTVSKAESRASQELEDLRAQRDLWAGKVRSLVDAQRTPKITRGVRQVFGAIRQLKLGSDVGTLTRQGLFAWNPKRIPIATKAAAKSIAYAFSERGFARWARYAENHVLPNGRTAGAFYKKHGLQIADGITRHEEIVATRLINQIFDLLPKGLEKVGAKGAADTTRAYTSALGGSLERMQTVFINDLRMQMFDRAVKLGYDESELKNMARFINNVTGRGNLKKVPTAAEIIFTSPRYEASRWGTIGEFFRQPARLAKSIAKGKVDRSALSAIGDLTATAATVISVFKAAELAGYEVDWNPNSADFLKMRRGDEVWDVSAGIAPRIRDCVRLIVNSRNPDYGRTASDVLSKAAFRTISPGVRTPYTGVTQFGKDVKVDPFTGFEIPEDEQGWRAMAPLIFNAYEQTTKEEGPESGFKAAMKEFLGGGVNRYPQKDYPTPIDILKE